MHALLHAIPAADPGITAQFEMAYRRRLFHWAAEQVRGEFTAKTWQAFWQTAVENRPVADVATELSLSVGAVYISRSRVMRQAPEGMKPTEEDIQKRIAACLADKNFDPLAVAASLRGYRDQAVTNEQMAAVKVPTLGIVGNVISATWTSFRACG